MTSFEELRPLLRQLRIAHHLPGRIRLKLDDRALARLPRLEQPLPPLHRIVERLPGVRSVELNALALSCTVFYDPARVPPPGWSALIEGRDDADAQALEALLRQALALLEDTVPPAAPACSGATA
ncbi:hypothetical protein CLD22_03195 [Rubrivivax gelatinosus]|nr:hypothetical protein [Rubrivivax gelatinosus]